MSLAPGARLGVYEIVSLLGAGGMGEVYRARDARLNREVAIKVLGSFSGDADRLERFEQEARAAAALNHPNILSVFDVGSHDGAPYVVSELLEGETLRNRLNSGALPVRKAIDYAIQLAHGLAAAHEKGIVHRDLKPENIFLTTDERVKILDFGLAKLTQPAARSQEPAQAYGLSAAPTTPRFVTQSGMMLGTLGYAAPEQLRATTIDHRADVFSFGVVLYEMLSGRRAFQGPTPVDTMTAILKEAPADLPVADRHISPALARIVDRCLEKDAAARFQSTRDLGFALEGLSSSSESRLTAIAVAPVRASLWSSPRVAWLMAAACAVGGAVALGLAALGYVSPAVVDQPEMRLQVHVPEIEFGATGGLTQFALSPDARQFAFRPSGARGTLWVRALNSDTARPLAGTEGALHPFWSPDSQSIGFFSGGQLKRVDLADGLVRNLASAPNGAGGAWNAEGTILFTKSFAGPIYKVTPGGDAVAVTRTAPPVHSGHVFPRFLPDGRRFLLYAFGSGEGGSGVYVGSLDSEEIRRVVRANAAAEFLPPDRLLLSRDDALLAQRVDMASLEPRGEPLTVARSVYTDSVNGRAGVSASAVGPIAYRPTAPDRQLVWLDRGGRRIAPVGDAQAFQPMLSLSPDGSSAAVVRRFEGNNDVWVMDLNRGSLSRVTRDPAHEAGPVWAPDGSQIAFGSDRRSGVFDLYVKRLKDPAETLFITSTTDIAVTDWSSDGKWIAYRNIDPKTGQDMWAKSVGADDKPIAIAVGPAIESGGRFSPDGRWIAFVSTETSRSEVYVQPFPGPGERLLVSTEGGTAPHWSRDGRELFYRWQRNLMSVPVTVTSGALRAGKPVLLFEVPPGFGDIEPSPDGQRFLANAASEDPSLITILLNWKGGQVR